MRQFVSRDKIDAIFVGLISRCLVCVYTEPFCIVYFVSHETNRKKEIIVVSTIMSKRRKLILGFLSFCEEFDLVEPSPRRKRARSLWSRDIYLCRNRDNVFDNLMAKLKNEGEEFYKKFVRVSFTEFEYLHDKIKHRIQKQDTNMRKAISTQERLAATLWYLASGMEI